MPPDRRTASSFATATAQGLALSSHGADHAPSIPRGKACQTCRRRKLKCDGIRPLCGACKKSAMAHGDDLAVISCEYDDPNAPKRKRASPGSKVAALEAEITELKAAMAQAGLATGSTSSVVASGFPTDLSPPVIDYSSFPSEPAPPAGHCLPPAVFTAWYPPPAASDPHPSGSSGSRSSYEFPTSHLAQHPQQLTPPSTSDESSPGALPQSGDPMLDLLYPGWPRDLPSPELTNKLVEIFLTRPHICSDMISPSKLRTALLLPPTSPNFPHVGLLHLICGLAALMVSDDFFLGEDKYNGVKPTEYHAACGKAALDKSITSGEKLFQVAQTVTLLCFWAYTNARFVELWLYCGQATRILTPLGLNHLRTAGDNDANPSHFKPFLLPPTSDPAVLYERSMAFHFAFLADRFSSGNTGWATSLDDADITTALPHRTVPYPIGNLEESPLSPRNPMFFLSHPPHLVGPLQLMLKSVVLFGRVNAFTQRAPHQKPTATSWDANPLNDPVRDIRDTDAFKRLDVTIQSFRASIPREYQLHSFVPGSGTFPVLDETRLCLVHGLAHISTILLHEPWVASLDEGDFSMRKCSESAREILQAVFILLSTSYEISLYSPYINMVWSVAGRTFVREMAIKIVKNDTNGLDELRSHVETLLMALRAHKTPLGAVSASQLEFLLSEPMRTLPPTCLNPNNPAPQHPHHGSMTGPSINLQMEQAQRDRRENLVARTLPTSIASVGLSVALEKPGKEAVDRNYVAGLAAMNNGKLNDATAAIAFDATGLAKGAETVLRDPLSHPSGGLPGMYGNDVRFTELSGEELAELESLLGL
ncbi:hypothetical protein JCM11641_006413 [Rhodosporidiobolus odoratus]